MPKLEPKLIIDMHKNEFTALCDDCEHANECERYKEIPVSQQNYIKWCSAYKPNEQESL